MQGYTRAFLTHHLQEKKEGEKEKEEKSITRNSPKACNEFAPTVPTTVVYGFATQSK